MKKVINFMVLISIIIAVYFSVVILETDTMNRFGPLYSNIDKKYYVTFNDLSKINLNKEDFVEELIQLSKEFEFDIQLASTDENETFLYIKMNNEAAINALPITPKDSLKNDPFFYSSSSKSHKVLNFFFDQHYEIRSFNEVNDPHYNLTSGLSLMFKEIQTQEVINQLQASLSKFDVEIFNVKFHSGSIVNVFMTEILFFMIAVLLASSILGNALLKSTKEISIKRIEGYSVFKILWSSTFEQLSKYNYILLLGVGFLFYRYLVTFGSIANFWLCVFSLLMIIQLGTYLLTSWILIYILDRSSAHSGVKGILPMESYSVFMSFTKMMIISILVFLAPTLQGSFNIFMETRKVEPEYLEKYENWYAISSAKMSYFEILETVDQSKLYSLLDKSPKFSFGISPSSYHNDVYIASVSKGYYEYLNVPYNESTIYYRDNRRPESLFDSSLISEWLGDESGSYNYVALDEDVVIYDSHNPYLSSFIGKDDLIMLLPNSEELLNSSFVSNGSLKEVQTEVNQLTSSLGLGDPYIVSSYVEDFKTWSREINKALTETLILVASIIIILFYYNFILISIRKIAHQKEDRIYAMEGYRIKKSVIYYATNNLSILVGMYLVSILFLKASLGILLSVSILVITIDTLVIILKGDV